MNALIKVKIEFNNNGNPINVQDIFKDYPQLKWYLDDFMKAKDSFISKAEVVDNQVRDCDIRNALLDWSVNERESDKLFKIDPKGFQFTYTFLCYVDC